MKLFALTLFTALSAQAGTWTCQTGLEGKQIYQAILKGDAQGHMLSPAQISIAGLPGGTMRVYGDTTAVDELVRVVIGAENPQSKNRLRIMAQPLEPGVYKAYTLLSNFPIPQELEGTCRFSP